MKMFVALVSGILLSSAAVAQHEHGASTGGGNESNVEATERSSGTPAAPAGDRAAASDEGSDRRICRRVDRTGSRMARDQLCMTARQWRDYNRDN
jgi:hypothetical protein